MTEFNLNTSLDYTNKTITACLSTSSVYTGIVNPVEYRIIDTDGVLIKYFTLHKGSGYTSFTSYTGSSKMELDLSIYEGGYDTSIYRTDLSGVYISNPHTMWEMQAEVGFLQSFTRAIEVEYTTTDFNVLDSRNNMYIDTPIIIERGDSVFQGAINTVTDKNKVTITVDKSLASYTGYNLKNTFMEVISGSASGQIYTVTNQNLNILSIDKNCYGLSGQIVKFKPYRIVTSYSGLSYNGSGSNLGENGLKARFGLNEPIPGKIGSMSYTSGYYSGSALVDYPNTLLAGLPFYTVSTVALKNDLYMREIQRGDLVFYNPASSPSSTYTGVILYTGPHANAAQGDFFIQYWPANAASTGSTYTIYRSNISKLETIPKFGETYTTIAKSIDTSGSWISTIETPEIKSFEFTANEQESTYNLVSETSHFMAGPISLSNGQIITDGVGNPSLLISGSLYQGDPANPVRSLHTGMYSTQDTDIGEKYKGMYFDNGVAVFTSNSAFTTAQTIKFESEVRYGLNKIKNINIIPVQPAV